MTKTLPTTVVCLIALAFSSTPPATLAATKKKAKPPVNVKKALTAVLPKAVIGGTLEKTLVQLGDLIKVPVVANWGALELTGVKRDTTLAVRSAKKISGETLVELVLVKVATKGNPLSWYDSNGVLVITTQQAVLRRKARMRIKPTRAKFGKKVKTTAFREHSFKNEPLKNVIDTYRNITGLNFHVNWKSLENAGIDREEPITLVVKDVSIARALDMVTDQLSEGKDKFDSVYWLVDRGVITISTGQALNATNIITIHEVGDLLFPVPNFKGPRLGRSTKGAGTQDDGQGIFEVDAEPGNIEKEDASETRAKTKSSLEKIIIDSIGEEMWMPGGGKGSVRYFRNKLIISQTKLGYLLMKKAGVLDAFKQIR